MGLNVSRPGGSSFYTLERPPTYAERPPTYAERTPTYAERPPTYAERPPTYAERPLTYAERPLTYAEHTATSAMSRPAQTARTATSAQLPGMSIPTYPYSSRRSPQSRTANTLRTFNRLIRCATYPSFEQPPTPTNNHYLPPHFAQSITSTAPSSTSTTPYPHCYVTPRPLPLPQPPLLPRLTTTTLLPLLLTTTTKALVPYSLHSVPVYLLVYGLLCLMSRYSLNY